MRFYLGTHQVSQKWWDAKIPLFVSRRILATRRTLPRARSTWALDSGGFTELHLFGEWRTGALGYAHDVSRFALEIGALGWCAPQDWMCEPMILERTGKTVAEHQRLTVENFLRLRQILGRTVIPVLQGWEKDDYLRCWEMYHRAGVDLEWEDVIGVGTVCRRQNTAEAGVIMRSLADQLLGVHLHGFGVKITGLESFGDVLASADSMAWSFQARRSAPIHGHPHKSCANCLDYALRWYQQVTTRLGQLRLEVAA